jgi:antitoxin HicB
MRLGLIFPSARHAVRKFQCRRAKRGYRMVPVPLWLAPKLALYVAMRDQQVNNSELAWRLGVHERVVRRMMDPQHATKAEKIQAAPGVLGKHMTVEVRDAA